jgi:enamine deaminase RidA (YjgF/YER057c/UK114 family)
MPDFPRHIPTQNGEVTLATARDEFLYNNFKFASARRAGNTIYVSGVIAGPEKGEGRDLDAFKNQLRRAFNQIGATMKAAGADFSKIVMLNTFHVWKSANFDGDTNAQLTTFVAVKDEFISPPHPAWTAVGTTGLAIDTGVVEIQAIAQL